MLLADAFALYLKTKNFHWHISGRHFRDYHLMLDEQSDPIFATTDQLAERVRKLGGTTLSSIGQIAKLQTIKDNNERLCPAARDAARVDGGQQACRRGDAQSPQALRRPRGLASASLLENFIDETERRTWFLFEASRQEGGNEA